MERHAEMESLSLDEVEPGVETVGLELDEVEATAEAGLHDLARRRGVGGVREGGEVDDLDEGAANVDGEVADGFG